MIYLLEKTKTTFSENNAHVQMPINPRMHSSPTAVETYILIGSTVLGGFCLFINDCQSVEMKVTRSRLV